jgi:hypothetical protein
MPVRFAGFLPVTHVNDKWYALLGKERDGWGPFGGGPDHHKDCSVRATALREAREESHGALLETELRRAQNGHTPLIENESAVIYAVMIPRALHLSLNNSYAHFARRAPRAGCFEKQHAQWFPLQALSTACKWIQGCALRKPLNFDFQAALPMLNGLHKIYRPWRWTLDRVEDAIARRSAELDPAF